MTTEEPTTDSSSGSPAQPLAPATGLPLAPPCGHLVDHDYEEDEHDDSSACSSHLLMGGRRRTIKFPPQEEIATYHEGADMDELAANRREVWYQYEELKTIKRKALSISKEAQRYGLGAVLTNTYGKGHCDETQLALNTWARNGSSRRGLERWINDEYAAKRSDIRKRTIQSVIRAQAKMKDSELDDADYSTKVLSRLSEAFSIDSKQFARGMGVADEIAAQLANAAAATEETDATGTKELSPVAAALLGSSPEKMAAGDDRNKGVARKHSPHSVMNLPNSPIGKRVMGTRNLGLTAPSVSADFRHYY